MLAVWPLKDRFCACPFGPDCLSPGKHPNEWSHSVKGATKDIDEIAAWPFDLNVGVALGAVSGGLMVIDVDQVPVAELMLASGIAERTLTATTPSGGLHLYVTTSDSTRGFNLTNQRGEHLGEVRGDGQYVVAAPSRGANGRCYMWVDTATPVASFGDLRPIVGRLFRAFGVEVSFADELTVTPLDDPSVSPSPLPERFQTNPRVSLKLKSYAFGNLRPEPGAERSDLTYELGMLIAEAYIASDTVATAEDLAANVWWLHDHIGLDKWRTSKEFMRIALKALQKHPMPELGESEPSAPEPEDKPPIWFTAREFSAYTPPRIDWLVPGITGRGLVTELSANPKVGKTTFTLHMLAELIHGGEFLGDRLDSVRVIYLTEEGASFAASLHDVGLAENDDLHIRVRDYGADEAWFDIVADVRARADAYGAHLIVVDTLPHWAQADGDDENNSSTAQRWLAPLIATAREDNLGVLVVRHDRKSGGSIELSGRGSSAFTALVDNIVRISKPGGHGPSNRRRVEVLGRHRVFGDDGVFIVELVDGEYVRRDQAERDGDARTAIRDMVLDTLSTEPDEAKTRQELEAVVVATGLGSESTLRRALDDLEREGLIYVDRSERPHRYTLTEKGAAARGGAA